MAKNFGRVNVSITASTGGLTAGLASAGRQLLGFKKGMTATSMAIGGLRSAFSSLLPALGIIGSVGAAIGALANATRAAEQLHNMSQELGIAAGELQVLRQVASEAGVDQGQLTVALRRSTRMVGELAQGTPAAQKAFAQLGLTMADLANRSTTDQFALISQRISELPPQMQAAAAIDIFGRSGQGLLNFIRQGGESIREMDRLLTQLGVKMSNEQVAAIESMGDAIGRLTLPMQGFINQFLAQLAPAVTTIANLFVRFFADTTQGFSIATTVADVFAAVIRQIAGRITQVYGVFQVLASFIAGVGAGLIRTFELISGGLGEIVRRMRIVAEQLPGFDVGLASSLRSAENAISAASAAAGQEGDIWGQTAADSFANGLRNISDPFAAFDAEFEKVTSGMQQAGAAGGQAFGEVAGASVAATMRASSEALKAIVVGTSAGEEFRNSILRGADPRLAGDAAQETADNTGEMVDQLDELNGNLAGGGGFALAAISV